MKARVFVLILVVIVALPLLAQREGNVWIPYSVAPHPSACNPALMSEAAGQIHLNMFTATDQTGRLRFVYIANLKGKGTLSVNGTAIAEYNVSQNEAYREIALPNPGYPVEIYDTYRLNITVKGGGASGLGNLYELYTLRYLVNADGEVSVSFERHDLGCR